MDRFTCRRKWRDLGRYTRYCSNEIICNYQSWNQKDFIDYYYLLKTYSLKELLGLYVRKFSDAQLFTAIKSLTYFQDAEADPMPRMTENLDWENVKKSIVDTVNAYI